ncbi:TPA: type II secretion system pilot lipoprotein GspS [Yersinia enterocolitica]|nr:type II secretion system pilot lipoprotein GspS [Yersinia enterocolitica]
MSIKLYLRPCVMGFVCIWLLTACQQRLNHPQPDDGIQMQQLSALVAGSQYLKQDCNRSGIPEDKVLIETALYLAKNRGWSVGNNEYNQLNNKSHERYKALVQAESAHMQKCAQLEKLVSPFLDEAKRSNNKL